MKTYYPSLFQRIVLAASGLIAGAIAWRGLVEPTAFLQSFNIVVADAAGRNEIIGQYGGFFAAVGALLGAAAIGWVRTSSALLLLICLYGGVLAGRLVALSQDGWAVFVSYPSLLQMAHIMDAIGLFASIAALVTCPDRAASVGHARPQSDQDP